MDVDGAAGASPAARLLCRPLPAVVALLCIYLALAFLLDPAGSLGTDTGGKVATVKVMSERGTFDADVGYWAADFDPDARLHGLIYTTRYDDKYVNVTSLPMVLAARPLWDVGGPRAILLLPMLGAVAAAGAALVLCRRLDGGDGWIAFWLVGLASPVLIYALDFWEHSIGLALMSWGMVLVLRMLERPTVVAGALAGAAFGAAAALRTEAFVYGFVGVGLGCLLLARRAAWSGALRSGVGALVGFAGLTAVNAVLESAVIGEAARSGRVSGAAGGAGVDLAFRLREGLVTTASPMPSTSDAAIALGLALTAGLVYVALAARRADRVPAYLMCGLVTFLYLVRFADGLGFVPGVVAASPVAGLGIALAWRHADRAFTAMVALLAMPLVWLFQFSGGAVPQWGGRYMLTSGLLLTVVGVAASGPMAPLARRSVVGAAVAVTAFGFAWQVQRTHVVADAGRVLAERTEDVLIAPNGFLSREFGAFYPKQDWLGSSRGAQDLEAMVGVAKQSGATSLGVVTTGESTLASALVRERSSRALTFDGWVSVGVSRIDFIGTSLLVHRFERTAA